MAAARSCAIRSVFIFLVATLASAQEAPRDDTPAPRTPPAAEPPAKLTLLTYNVLEHREAVEKRLPALFKILDESKADAIALQEVSPWFLDALRKQPWFAKYRLAKPDGDDPVPGGLVLLSKYEIQKAAYTTLPGRLGRGVLTASIRIPVSAARQTDPKEPEPRPDETRRPPAPSKGSEQALAIATVHLESFLDDGEVRAAQLGIAFELLKEAGDAVLLGDFNFGDADRWETEALDRTYADLWPTLKPKDPGFTWNIESSGLAKRNSFPDEPSRRLDRILVRSQTWRPSDVRIVGDRPVEPGRKDLFPSDHFGVVGTLERK